MAKPVNTRDDAYMHHLAAEMESRAKAAAAELGPPAESMRLSDKDKARYWNHELPAEQAATLLQWAQAVVEGGQQVPPPDVGHPHPERVLEWYAKGAGPEAAAEALWPLRRDLYTRGIPNVKEQVKEAERLAKLAERAARPEQEGAGNATVTY